MPRHAASYTRVRASSDGLRTGTKNWGIAGAITGRSAASPAAAIALAVFATSGAAADAADSVLGPAAPPSAAGLYTGPGAGRGAVEAVEHPLLVLLGLKASDEPRAGVRQGLVVQVHGVLRGEHHPEAEGARLLEQGQDGRPRRG